MRSTHSFRLVFHVHEQCKLLGRAIQVDKPSQIVITGRQATCHCTLVKVSPWLSRYRSLVITYRHGTASIRNHTAFTRACGCRQIHIPRSAARWIARSHGEGDQTRLGRWAPGSIAARRAAGRGRREPPAARRPSRCRGTASSTLQQQPSKQSARQPQW